VSAAAVQYGFDAGHCEQANSTNQAKAEANSQALTIGDNDYLDKASLKIIKEALVEHLSPVASSLAALAKDVRGLDRAANAFRLEIYGSVLSAMRRIRDKEPAQRPFNLDHGKAKVFCNGSLSPKTKVMVEDAIFAALAPLVTLSEVWEQSISTTMR
jgi:hypothetical protein